MARYGILKSSTNTGSDADLIATFTAPLSIESMKPNLMNETVTLKRKIAYTDIQRWEINAGLIPTRDAAELMVHSVVNGYSEGFYIRMPQIYRKAQSIPDNVTFQVASDVEAGIASIQLICSSGSKILPVGEFIRFQGHSKVYMVSSSTSLSNGINQIEVFPKLVKAIDANEPVSFGSKVTMAAMYGDDAKIGITYVDGIMAQMDQITIIERL